MGAYARRLGFFSAFCLAAGGAKQLPLPTEINGAVYCSDPPPTLRFSGLSPNFICFYQVNVTLPQHTPMGNAVPIVIEIGGTQSPSNVTITVNPAASVASQGAP